MKIEILESGTEGKTLNPYKHPEALDPAWDIKRKRFTEAESERKVYEIDTSHIEIIRGREHRYEPGIRECELLPNGKIKITD